jgi:type I restriction enzyme M protein
MNADTKRHIDSARQVLVGVVPNPTSQIEQITNALIYKFMDDMDQSAIKAGGSPSFFVDNLESYAWTRLMDPRMGNQERMNLYGEALIKFSQAKQLPELFRGIFKSAFLPYRSPETLGLFLKEIDYFDYSHPEELGNAYEYLLSIMSSQGDAGQFRTPRHIIDFIVDVVNPTKDDKVLDPACGTGGFLVSSYKHILEQHDGKDDPKKKEKPLTPDERKKLMTNFEGYDIDPTMVRIAQVNMYLHQFKNPKIFQYDSLSSEERWNDKFDVVLANPPFMSPKGGIKPHSKFSIPSSRSEVLFVDYIMNHLRPKGRAGIIVPEGIIFQSGTAYKQLRKNLVQDGLYAVVSLPSGVFAPYSGVKTSILLFNNELAKTSKEILFIKIESDGFDLGAQRRVSTKNDLPQALVILNKWNTGEKTENKLAVYVEKTKIAENGDYNLSGDRYRIATDYTNAKWPMVKLGEVIHLDFGERITKNNKQGTKYPVYGGGGESFRTDEFNRENEYVIARFAMSEHCVRFVAGQFWMMDSGGTFSIKAEYQDRLNKDFVGKILQSRQEDIFMCARGGAQKNLNNDHFYELKIPLPPLEIQGQIVAELDGYTGIIAGAKQIVQNWKPKIDIDPEWKKVKLGEVCEIGSSKRVFESEWKTEGVPFYRAREIVKLAHNGYVENELFISEEMFQEYSKKYGSPNEGDLMVTGVGTLGICYLVGKNERFYFKDGNIIWLKKFDEKVSSTFLKHLFEDDFVIDQIKATASGGTVGTYTITNANNTIIPLPPLAIQKQIVEKIEAERVLVESAKKLIDIYEQKTKEAIAKLWEE